MIAGKGVYPLPCFALSGGQKDGENCGVDDGGACKHRSCGSSGWGGGC